MNLEQKNKAQEDIQTALGNFHTVKKAVLLGLRNYTAGIKSLDPKLKQVYLVSLLNSREEIEKIIDTYAAGSDIPELVHAKLLDIYSECLQLIRAYTHSKLSRTQDKLLSLVEYEQQIALAKEVDDSKLVIEEFFEDTRASALEDISNI